MYLCLIALVDHQHYNYEVFYYVQYLVFGTSVTDDSTYHTSIENPNQMLSVYF
jgi:hypothetical protein